MTIREADSSDFDAIWPIFSNIVSAGETYAFARDTTKKEAFDLWIALPRKTFVFEENGRVLGTYFLKSNQPGPGSHVCNCGYMVSSQASGKGIATAMCEHSQSTALALGYKAMQFNFVVSSNIGAIGLWTKLGYDTAGKLPKAFNHPEKGFIDALVMYKWLASE